MEMEAGARSFIAIFFETLSGNRGRTTTFPLLVNPSNLGAKPGKTGWRSIEPRMLLTLNKGSATK